MDLPLPAQLVSPGVLRAMTQLNRRTRPSSGGKIKKVGKGIFANVEMLSCLTTLIYVHFFSNITDVYEKVRANRRDIDKKCPRTKCEKILNKVKKVKASVEFIQTMNLTMLEQMVEMLKNSSTAQQLLDLEPIKACMADPTVSFVTTITINVTTINVTTINVTTITINVTITTKLKVVCGSQD